MKWNEIYILVFQSSNDLSWKTAFHLHKRYNIPTDNIAVFLSTDMTKYHDFLSRTTLGSKIIVLAHGTADYIDASPFGNMYPVFFLQFLYDKLGLRNAGLISFKSCMIGSGYFLDKCAQTCELVFKDLYVGWWKGYKQTSATHFKTGSCSFSSGSEDYDLRENSNCEFKLNDDARIKFIKGNIYVSPPYASGKRWENILKQ
ncbi:hypothetical protein ABSZ42_004876 [Salmonella enterica subsp. enterica serovar Newport]|nr:hypothetical protein [Salmonella enterica subsp. enterica serovar Newport]ECK2143287.1 hypothetical protein [Salmonella enterica subsp. enterica serovar Enteritidis]EGX3499915.1 hypothetical protein [Salmonella enterica]ELP2195222.1 hypothetical protein [Salmonella enterica subsp. enterica serovar Champaign]MKU04692.1 hypothetical protein [Salmonella enterica subsp. enterica serovar Kinondoni]